MMKESNDVLLYCYDPVPRYDGSESLDEYHKRAEYEKLAIEDELRLKYAETEG